MPNNTVIREQNERQEHASYMGLSNKWVSAIHLKYGDRVLLSDDTYGIIESVTTLHLFTPETTYNFEVEDYHTYFVGNGVCVHNKGCNVETGEYYVREKGVEVRVNPGEASGNVAHNTPHGHVKGNGAGTTVGLDKIPMKGHEPLSRTQTKMINKNWDYIEKIIRKVWPK